MVDFLIVGHIMFTIILCECVCIFACMHVICVCTCMCIIKLSMLFREFQSCCSDRDTCEQTLSFLSYLSSTSKSAIIYDCTHTIMQI